MPGAVSRIKSSKTGNKREYFYGELKKKSGRKYGLVFELELGQVSDWDGLASKISEGMRQAKREFVNPSPCIHTT